MSSQTVMPQVKQWIEDHREEMVAALREQLRIPSKEGEPQPGAPFGPECRRALDTVLALADSAGFRTKNLDGYAGHAEFGDGEEMVMSLGHLDVVPEGDGWRHHPYGATLEDGYLYARGASDDKGPTYATFFAGRALKELGVPLKRRIRTVFGCNEESGFRCMKHYFAHEEPPTYGFAPDAEWPLVFAEKGICNLTLTKEIPPTDGLRVASASGGDRPNIVPQFAEAVLDAPPVALAQAREVLERHWDKNVTVASGADSFRVSAVGRPAHGATPFQGDNAIVRLVRALREVKIEGEWVEALFQMGHPSGVGLGLHGRDEIVGDLTSNLGMLKLEDGTLEVLFNLRYPVEWNRETIEAKTAKVREKHGFTIGQLGDSPPLYVPVSQEPVSTIIRVVSDEFGEELEPQTMGGGTYARTVPNCVAVGTTWPGDGPPHEADERYAVSSYLRAAAIYAEIFFRLANLP